MEQQKIESGAISELLNLYHVSKCRRNESGFVDRNPL